MKKEYIHITHNHSVIERMFDIEVLRSIWFIYFTTAKNMVIKECIILLSFLLFLDYLNEHNELNSAVYKIIEVVSPFVVYYWVFTQVWLERLYFGSIL